MQHQHVGPRQLHFFLVQNIEILQAHVILFVEEALSLHTGHVEKVEVSDDVLQTLYLLVMLSVRLQHILADIAGELKLLRGNAHEIDIVVTHQRLDQGMDGTAEFQVSAQADGQMIETALQGADRHQVCQGLGGMLMSAVARVNHRDRGNGCGYHGRTLLRMTHGAYISIAGNHTNRIGNTFSLGCGAGRRTGEA